jgi:hypothetical protein
VDSMVKMPIVANKGCLVDPVIFNNIFGYYVSQVAGIIGE